MMPPRLAPSKQAVDRTEPAATLSLQKECLAIHPNTLYLQSKAVFLVDGSGFDELEADIDEVRGHFFVSSFFKVLLST